MLDTLVCKAPAFLSRLPALASIPLTAVNEGNATVLALTPSRVGGLEFFKHQVPHTVA